MVSQWKNRIELTIDDQGIYSPIELQILPFSTLVYQAVSSVSGQRHREGFCQVQCLRKMNQNGNVSMLCFPRLGADDPSYDAKQQLLAERGLQMVLHLSPGLLSDCDKHFQNLLETARILQLTEEEIYFVEDNHRGPFSPRNELRALGMLESMINIPVSEETLPFIKSLQDTVKTKLNTVSSSQMLPLPKPCTEQQDVLFLNWALNEGVQSMITIAEFEGQGRGGVAVRNIDIGGLVLEVPKHLLICEDTAKSSEMGSTYKELEGLSGETIALLWSIKERDSTFSKFAPYFAALPKSFQTGLSIGVEALKELEGTLVFEQIVHAKQHLHNQYEALFPALSECYPEAFPKEIYTWDNFLWAAELWYSNGVKVEFCDGERKTCLIPLVGILNHAIFPHVTHYSKLDESSKTLKLHAIRPCKAGEQCFLSYGALPNTELFTFYGFVIEDNPYDSIPIELDFPDAATSPYKHLLFQKCNIACSHMVRTAALCKSELETSIPTRLLAALRILMMEEEDAENLATNPRHTMVSPTNECAVYETLLSILDQLLCCTNTPDDCVRASESGTNWDTRLAARHKKTYVLGLKSLQESCSRVLESLRMIT